MLGGNADIEQSHNFHLSHLAREDDKILLDGVLHTTVPVTDLIIYNNKYLNQLYRSKYNKLEDKIKKNIKSIQLNKDDNIKTVYSKPSYSLQENSQQDITTKSLTEKDNNKQYTNVNKNIKATYTHPSNTIKSTNIGKDLSDQFYNSNFNNDINNYHNHQSLSNSIYGNNQKSAYYSFDPISNKLVRKFNNSQLENNNILSNDIKNVSSDQFQKDIIESQSYFGPNTKSNYTYDSNTGELVQKINQLTIDDKILTQELEHNIGTQLSTQRNSNINKDYLYQRSNQSYQYKFSNSVSNEEINSTRLNLEGSENTIIGIHDNQLDNLDSKYYNLKNNLQSNNNLYKQYIQYPNFENDFYNLKNIYKDKNSLIKSVDNTNICNQCCNKSKCNNNKDYKCCNLSMDLFSKKNKGRRIFNLPRDSSRSRKQYLDNDIHYPKLQTINENQNTVECNNIPKTNKYYQENSNTDVIESPYQYQESPNQYQESPNQYQESPNQYQESPNQYQESPNQYQESPNQYQESPNQYQESPNQYQESPNQYQESPNQYQESPNQYQESPNQYQESPNQYQESPNQYQELPNQYQESPNQYQESPNQYQESPNQYQESPNQYQESPNQYQESPNQYQESPNQYQESPNLYQNIIPTINKNTDNVLQDAKYFKDIVLTDNNQINNFKCYKANVELLLKPHIINNNSIRNQKKEQITIQPYNVPNYQPIYNNITSLNQRDDNIYDKISDNIFDNNIGNSGSANSSNCDDTNRSSIKEYDNKSNSYAENNIITNSSDCDDSNLTPIKDYDHESNSYTQNNKIYKKYLFENKTTDGMYFLII